MSKEDLANLSAGVQVRGKVGVLGVEAAEVDNPPDLRSARSAAEGTGQLAVASLESAAGPRLCAR